MNRRLLLAALPLFAIVMSHSTAAATEVWPGRTFAFSKAAFTNPALEANQDRITAQVWITRASSMGIFNIQQEPSYTHDLSPMDTEWATGDAVDHASLGFQPWEIWANSNPPSTVGIDAVVHLITDDIYIDIVFDTWGGQGGAFSYRRGVRPTTPTHRATWGRIKRLFR